MNIRRQQLLAEAESFFIQKPVDTSNLVGSAYNRHMKQMLIEAGERPSVDFTHSCKVPISRIYTLNK